MKKVIGLLMMLTAFMAYGQQYDREKDFKVEKTSDGKAVIIVGYEGKNTTINIPPKIQKLPVIGIDRGAFVGKQLTSVNIPDTVTFIGNSAFRGNKLTTINIPNSVTTIGQGAFASNQLLCDRQAKLVGNIRY